MAVNRSLYPLLAVGKRQRGLLLRSLQGLNRSGIQVIGEAGIHNRLQNFQGEEIAILVTSTPVKYPASPYEYALLPDTAPAGGDFMGIFVESAERRVAPVMCRYNQGEFYDVAVVGAGPAGSLTAALAARAGLSVILLERKKRPREKTCGGLISARARALLPSGFTLPSEISAPVRSVRVISGGRSRTYEAETELGAVVKRAQFDLLLAGYARECGAALREESPLRKLKRENDGPGSEPLYRLECGGGNRVYARYVVGADGAAGRCAVLAGLRVKSPARPCGWGCAGLFSAAPPGEERETAVFYPLPFNGGLGWSFPGRDWTNKGVGGLAGPGRLKREFQRLFPGVERQALLSAWPLPFTGPLRRPARENLILVGDAAGLVDPFSGEGIYHAFKSAILAADAVCTALAEKRPAGDIYAALFRSHFRRGFFPSLLGALALHARSVAAPGTLPRSIAAIMLNKHWFNRNLPDRFAALHHSDETGARP